MRADFNKKIVVINMCSAVQCSLGLCCTQNAAVDEEAISK